MPKPEDHRSHVWLAFPSFGIFEAVVFNITVNLVKNGHFSSSRISLFDIRSDTGVQQESKDRRQIRVAVKWELIRSSP